MYNRKVVSKNIKFFIIISIFIIVFTIVIAWILILSSINNFNNFTIDKGSIIKNNGIIMKGNNKAKVYIRKSKEIKEIDVEEYVAGVVSSEMQVNFEKEALKAQAVAARTYYYSKRLSSCSEGQGAEICDSIHCQVYTTKEEKLTTWPESERESNWNKIREAVKETEGDVLVYNGELVKYPQFFSTSSGKTENCIDVFSEDIPYLKSIESPGEEIAPKFKSIVNIDKSTFINTITSNYRNTNLNYENLQNNIKILSRTEGGAVKEIKLGKVTISGVEFRNLFNINSANFTLNIVENEVIINCTGYGHGVGMSQWGANIMAKEGKNYKDILKHYYSGVNIEKVILED